MITPYGQECKFYYQDFYRGRSTQECRLLLRRPQRERWDPSLCRSCPIPGILRANACPNMMLEAQIIRRFFFWRRVKVSAFCLKTLKEVENPYVGCGECHLHRPGARELWNAEEESTSAKSRAISSGSNRGSA
jgi:hypothetical protein